VPFSSPRQSAEIFVSVRHNPQFRRNVPMAIMKRLAILVATVCVFGAAGYGLYRYCNPPGDYATPEACFAAMTEAREKKDFAKSLSCVSPKLQNQQVGWLAYQLQLKASNDPKMRKQVLTIFEKHDLVDVDVMELMQIHEMPRGKGAGYALDLVGSRVIDKAAFLSEIDRLASPEGKPMQDDEKPCLENVTIDGDYATGTIKTKSGASMPACFRRINRSWVMADPPERSSTRPEEEPATSRRSEQSVARKTAVSRKCSDSKNADDMSWKMPSAEPAIGEKERVVRDRRNRAAGLAHSNLMLADGDLGAVPALIKMLKDEDNGVRAVAADSLGRHGAKAKDAVPDLVDMLKDKRRGSERSRCSAAKALGAIGPEAKSAIPALVELLRNSDEDVRCAAIAGLSGMGPASVPILIDLLKDKDHPVRLKAIDGLGHVGADAAPAIPALAEFLRSQDAEMRRSALRALGDIGRPALPRMLELLKDKNGQLRGYAAFVIDTIVGRSLRGRTGPEAKVIIAALTDALKDQEPEVREEAAQALRVFGTEGTSAIPALIELLKDARPEVRGSAARAFGTIGRKDKSLVPAIAELLRDDESSVRRSATDALVELGPKAIPILLELLKHKDDRLRRGAAHALGAMGSKAKTAIPALKELLNDKDVEVRLAAHHAIRRIEAKAE
jgi:HEAT repeat protein